MAAGQRLLGADGLVASADVARGERVFVELRDDRLLVGDRGETCRYLERGDGAHRPLGEAEVRRLCGERGAVLAAVGDMWPHMTVAPSADLEIAEAVRIVGEAIEHVFAAAVDLP